MELTLAIPLRLGSLGEILRRGQAVLNASNTPQKMQLGRA